MLLAIVRLRNLIPLLTVLKAHKIDSFFKTIRLAQDMIEREYKGKPHPDKLNCVLRELTCESSKAVMVGDTFMDIKMAKNSLAFALDISWEYHDEQTLFAHGADVAASSVSHVSEIVQRILYSQPRGPLTIINTFRREERKESMKAP